MTTHFSTSFTSLRITAFLVIAAGATAGSAPAQAGFKGSYVFSESGASTSTLASLIFADDGSASGTAVVQQLAAVTSYAVQGAYITNDDGSKTLTLSATSLDAVDQNGDPLMFTESLLMFQLSNNSFATLRTNPGQYVGELIPAAGALAPGSYQINGRPADPSDTSIELVNVDTAGAVSGQKVTNSFGLIATKSLSGNTGITPTGFQQITVSTSYTDADGNPQTATESYLALPTQKDVRMLQTVGGRPALLTMSK